MALPRDDLAPLQGPYPDWFKAAFEVPRSEGSVEVDGCAIHYFEWGERSAPPVLMTHGFMAHARVFAFVAPFLASRFHLVSYDLSSMGDSAARPEPGDRADEAMAVAQATGLFDHVQKPIFVAHSFGGTVAIAAAERHPEAFGGLVICDLMMLREPRLRAMFGGPSPAKDRPPGPRVHKVYPDLPTALDRYRLTPSQPCENDFLLEYLAHHSLKAVEGGFRWKFDPSILDHDRRQSRLWADVPHRFAALGGRRAIVHGRRSKLFDNDSADYVGELAGPEVPIIGLPEAHHHLMLDQPLAFTSVLDTLLSVWTAG